MSVLGCWFPSGTLIAHLLHALIGVVILSSVRRSKKKKKKNHVSLTIILCFNKPTLPWVLIFFFFNLSGSFSIFFFFLLDSCQPLCLARMIVLLFWLFAFMRVSGCNYYKFCRFLTDLIYIFLPFLAFLNPRRGLRKENKSVYRKKKKKKRCGFRQNTFRNYVLDNFRSRLFILL